MNNVLTKILSAGWFIYGWFQMAKRDRVVDMAEIIELVAGLAELLEIPVRIKIPGTIEELTKTVAAHPTLRMVSASPRTADAG